MKPKWPKQDDQKSCINQQIKVMEKLKKALSIIILAVAGMSIVILGLEVWKFIHYVLTGNN